LAQQERVNIAVFIDFDNIEIGVRTTLSENFDIGTILEALKERGEVVTKIAYADWTRAGEYSRALTQHAIRLVQRNLTPGGDKNGADINLALDALEMAFTHPHINAYVIVGGDSDFLSLVEKLKQYDKKVFVVGGRAFTSVILQRNCHEFIAYENLVRRPSRTGGRPVAPSATAPMAQAFPLVRRALKILADREVTPQTGLLKSTLLQLDSTFSERNYGASSFLDFAEKLAQAGLVTLKHAGRSVTVELNPAAGDDPEAATKPEGAAGDAVVRPAPRPATPDEAEAGVVSSQEMPPQAGDQATGAEMARAILAAATSARWPMYLRNAKQILRAGGFDERRYGFSGLIELLRACQREGAVRLERDRRGGLRVFQGPQLAARLGPGVDAGVERVDIPAIETVEISTDDAPPLPALALSDDADDIIEGETSAVVDTTAELLGRAKPRRPRTRAAQPAGAATGGGAAGTGRGRRATTTTTTRKTGGARRSTRGRKADADDDNFGNV
jgi:uncharacterized protein (TIGR00288 family)